MENTQAPNQKKNFFSSINLDLIWQIVALGLLLGVVLFYFDGLQPLILSKYIDNSKSAVNQLETRFNDQTNQFSTVEEAAISQNKVFNPLQSCSLSQKVDLSVQQFSDLQDFKSNLLPDQTLENLPRYSIFYVLQVESKYDDLYNQYQDALTAYNKAYSSSLSLIDFIKYRNFWIDSCQQIQDSKGNYANLQTLCTALINTQKDFAAENIFTDVNNLSSSSIAKCNEITSYTPKTSDKGLYPDFNKWFLDWYTGFQNLASYNIDLSSEINNLSSTDSDFKNNIDSMQQYLIDFENSKTQSLSSEFYLIDFRS
jgi:hypothetical protein